MKLRPDDLIIEDVAVPFGATFEHAEAEVAAGYLVLAMKAQGNFDGVKIEQVIQAARNRKDDRAYSWLHNPFCNPNIDELIERGYAEPIGPEAEGKNRAVQFTDKGMETLAACRWRRPERSEGDAAKPEEP